MLRTWKKILDSSRSIEGRYKNLWIIQNNKFYLDKIITDLKFIIRQTSNKTKEEILSNELLIDSIMFRIIQVHENSKCLSEEFIEAHKEVPGTKYEA